MIEEYKSAYILTRIDTLTHYKETLYQYVILVQTLHVNRIMRMRYNVGYILIETTRQMPLHIVILVFLIITGTALHKTLKRLFIIIK